MAAPAQKSEPNPIDIILNQYNWDFANPNPNPMNSSITPFSDMSKTEIENKLSGNTNLINGTFLTDPRNPYTKRIDPRGAEHFDDSNLRNIIVVGDVHGDLNQFLYPLIYLIK